MKKKILSIAAAVMAFTTFGAMAQTPATGTTTTTTCTEQCAQGGKTCQAKPQDGKRRGDKAPKADPFAGITLTEAQQAKIKEINEKRQAQRAERKQNRQKQGEGTQNQRPDREAAQRQYLSDIKGVLTPDQYVVFLENIVVSGPQGGPRMQARGAKGAKGKAAGQQRAQRQGKAQAGQAKTAQRVTGPTIQATARTAQ